MKRSVRHSISGHKMTLESLSKSIKTTTDLRDIVSTMKALSSASILQYEKAGQSLENYMENIKKAFHVLMINQALKTPPKRVFKGCVAIVIGADNGLVGRFNKDVLSKATDYLKEIGISEKETQFISVGKRIASLLENGLYQIKAKYASSNSIKTVSTIAQSVISKMEQVLSEQPNARVFLFYHKRNGTSVQMEKVQIWPSSEESFKRLKAKKWATNNIPTFRMPAKKMKSFLMREYLTMVLFSAITMSLSAEHYTRMVNMQNAEKNIDERLEEMNLIYQQKRQEAITEELIDIVSGAEAMK